MMTREERRKKYGSYFTRSYVPRQTSFDDPMPDDLVLDPGKTLKKDDLKKYQYLQPIRDYMVERKGVDYAEKSADEVVNDFVEHMRFFNANTVSTAGEVRFVSKANDKQKAATKKAYQIYDQLGNVFVNDGAMGAVDGMWDYVSAAALDPTNYLGILTGGIARAGAAGVSLTGRQAVKAAVKKAGMQAALGGKGKAEAKAAAIKAGKEAAARAIKEGMTKKQAAKLDDVVAKRVMKEGRSALAMDAMKKKQGELFKQYGNYSLAATTGIDATAAVLQDIQAQQAYLEVGAQKDYNYLQTGFSSLLGGVAGAAQLGFGKFRGASGFEETGDPLEKVSNRVIKETAPQFKPPEVKKAADIIKKEIDAWNTKVERGGLYSQDAMPADLVHNIMLGEDKKGGLAKLFADKGYKLGKEKHLSDVMTNLARFMDDATISEINEGMAKYTGITIGELTEDKSAIGDFMAKKINEAGKTLNVMSQVRRVTNAGIVASQNKLASTISEIDAKEAITKELKNAKKSQKYKYGQSVWKRLLVSSPATTAVNVAGFSQFYMGQTLADIFNATTLTTLGLGQLGLGFKGAAAESFRKATALTKIQGQKFRNLMDPYTTYDAYMEFLEGHTDVRKTLFETVSGGVDATAARYNMNPDSKLFQGVEAMTVAAGQISGVKIQDSFTKSQMFMTELDKYLRLEKGMTLKEAMLADNAGELIDEVALQGALDGTLKSVFAKDYTTDQTPELLRTLAKTTETVSNTPVLGTIIPFGRFFNNVIATTYQWSPLAAPEVFIDFVKRIAKNEGKDFSEGEAFGRMMVGTSAILMAADYDKERRKDGLGVYEVRTQGGTIIDAKNTFPFSTFLVAGRIFNMKRNGEDVPRELLQEAGTQIGVGQLARDVQFGNDVNNLLDIMINSDGASRGMTVDGLYKVAGNFAAGFTRPVDAVNKTIGFAMGTDGAKDVRQAEGINVFTQSATKYVDNLFEALKDRVDMEDSITGEALSMATREGEVYDPNPFARIFGLTVKRGRTATEKAYSVAEMFPWQANERTNIPAYDKALNTLVAPLLERRMQILTRSSGFKNASLTGKRRMVKNMLSDTKAQLREDMGRGFYGAEPERLRIAARASTKATKEIRKEAMDMMKERFGVEGDLEDFNYNELDIFLELVEYLQDMYDETLAV